MTTTKMEIVSDQPKSHGNSGQIPPRVIISFDVEEHYRVEAAYALPCSNEQKATYHQRMVATTQRLLESLALADAKATFFFVGQIAEQSPQLIREVYRAGHEIACHSWDHQRITRHTPDSFAEDIRKNKDILEQCIGQRVIGFRAPTFSILPATAWAIDVLRECGFEYDSSIFPVRHDRYGIPAAPRYPFLACSKTASNSSTILEFPPTTYRLLKYQLPVAGGGYFRLLPTFFMDMGIRQISRLPVPVSMLYFHPWEFDPDQPKLNLSSRLSRMRTYIGISSNHARLKKLLQRYRFTRACDVAAQLNNLPLHPSLHPYEISSPTTNLDTTQNRLSSSP